jgi:superfamily II DNA or RNA helicase
MAEFIYNGGRMRIVTNHYFALRDKEELFEKVNLEFEDRVIPLDDIQLLQNTFSKMDHHFFDCLRYLLKHQRLQIKPVKFNNVDLAHSKEMILYDGKNWISTDGSINFTTAAILKNSESFDVNVSWEENKTFDSRIKEAKERFNKIFDGQHEMYRHLDSKELEVVIQKAGQNKELDELLEDSIELNKNSYYGAKVAALVEKKKKRFDYYVADLKGLPRFPFKDGPRDYQAEAYEAWKKNNYSGVFAMATGTGKTITSLNCLLNEYQKEKAYKGIILVPSIALLNQWEEEVKAFNFNSILKVGGGNKWENELATYVSNMGWGIKSNLIIISTYGSFVTDRFQKYFEKIQADFLLIADEAHNMGASNIQKMLPQISVTKKIGLSATPKRIYDEEGTEALDRFFNDKPPYIYQFGMEEALKRQFLTEYMYFPVIVELEQDELKEYMEISIKLLKFFDSESGRFKQDPLVEILLLKRKNIIHKAKRKILAFKSIVQELKKKGKLRYIFTYVPEGYVERADGDSEKMLDQFFRAGSEVEPGIKMNSYTAADSDLKDLLRGFSEGRIDLLFAMKMLDEGVDVPRAEVGIFCSSTGNPRQFIQRRGRLLRKHKEKAFATIYDMVVAPRLSAEKNNLFKMEKSLVKKELQRVGYFASLSMNFYDSKTELENICNKYELNLDQIIEEL